MLLLEFLLWSYLPKICLFPSFSLLSTQQDEFDILDAGLARYWSIDALEHDNHCQRTQTWRLDLYAY